MHKKITVFGIVTALLIVALCIGTATAYTNYETVWSSSGNQVIIEGNTGIAPGTTPTHYASSYNFNIDNKKQVHLITPFVNTITMTGTHPKVRYLYYQLNMPTGVSATTISVWTGPTLVYSKSVNWAGTGATKDYTLDMGSYHDMVRGINVALTISNSQASSQEVLSYGAGARWDW